LEEAADVLAASSGTSEATDDSPDD